MSKKQNTINKIKWDVMEKYYSPQQHNTFPTNNPIPHFNTETYAEPVSKHESANNAQPTFMQQKMEQSECISQQENLQEAFRTGTLSALIDNLYKLYKQKDKIKELSAIAQANEKNINKLFSCREKEKLNQVSLKQEFKQLQKENKKLHSDIKEIKKTLIWVNRYLNVSTKKASFDDLVPDLKYAFHQTQK